MAYSAHSSDLLLKWMFTTVTATRPVTWTVHLYEGDPEAAGVEFTDSGYASQSVTFSVADADSNSRSEATNDAAVAFPAIVDGPVTAAYVVIKDGAANILARIQLDPVRALDVGNILSFPAGGLVIKGE